MGLLGEVTKTTSGLCRRHLLGGGAQAVVGVAGAGDPPGAGGQRDQRVHRVGRLEPERGAARPAEGLQQLLDDLVGAVGRPGVGLGEPVAEVGGQVLAQLHRVPVGVAVQRARHREHRVRDRPLQLLARAVGVLVGVELDRHVELGRAVRVKASQVVPDGEGGAGRRSVTGARSLASLPAFGTRTRTAATWAARSSAPPRASTRGATSASESRSHSITLTTLR